jgi:hypothetical protein
MNNRECPKCAHITLGDKQVVRIVCAGCSHEYCFFHSNAHEGQSCKDYARRMRHEEALNDRAVKRVSKKCPGCQAATEKAGGRSVFTSHATVFACAHVRLKGCVCFVFRNAVVKMYVIES